METTTHFVCFLTRLEAETDPTLDLHIILDNASALKNAKVQAIAEAPSPGSLSFHADQQFLVESC